MAKYKVRWALVAYDNGSEQALAFRGMTVDDIKAEDAERLLADGAIVEEKAELDLPGTLLPLPTAPSDEELVAWVASASQTEVNQAVTDRPELRDRILDARAVYERRVQDHLEVLGQKIEAIPETDETRQYTELREWLESQDDPNTARAELDALAAGGGSDSGTSPSESESTGDEELDAWLAEQDDRDAAIAQLQELAGTSQVELNDEYFDRVVAQDVKDVSKFVSEYPQYAAQVLEAENRRQGANRTGVEKAVEAAAAFQGQ